MRGVSANTSRFLRFASLEALRLLAPEGIANFGIALAKHCNLVSVFFNLFTATEPYANVCVAPGTLNNDPSVYPGFCNKRISSQAISVCFGGTPGSHWRNPEVPRNPIEKHCLVFCSSILQID